MFDLRDQGQWLRRQLTILLKQLAGDKLSRKVVESIDWLTSPEQVAEYIRDLRYTAAVCVCMKVEVCVVCVCDWSLPASSNTLWPGGFPACSQPLPLDSTRAFRATLARAKLIGSIPGRLACYLSCTRGRETVCLPSCCVYMSYLSADDLKRFIGGDRTAKGMAR